MKDTKKPKQFENDSANYACRMNPKLVSDVLDDLGGVMLAKYRKQAELLRLVEATVRQATDGAPMLVWVWYLDFGREVYGRWRKVPSHALASELEILRHKWTVRGLDPKTLEKVEAAVVEMLNQTLADSRLQM
ncbi:MAG: hypothetical protein ABIL25_01940 [candidate division WOR-3 bacterium]